MPYFLASCGIKRFTGQSVEKNNDVIRRLYHLRDQSLFMAGVGAKEKV
jgi:hypothetical protein